MEISTSHYPSFGVTSKNIIIPQRCINHDRCNRTSMMPIKPKTKVLNSSNFPINYSNTKLSLQAMKLFGESSRFSKSILHGQHKSDSLRGYAQVESTDSDSILTKSEIEPVGLNSVLAEVQTESDDSDAVLANVSRFGSACYKFLRPYAVQVAVITAMSIYARVFVENPQFFKWSLLFKAFPGLIALLHSQAYYNGINQIYDIDIDRVNKPYLPLPAGELSLKQAWFIVIFNLLAGLLIFRLTEADAITTTLYCLGLFFGTFYSAPPFRFKGNPITTSIVLPLTNGFIHNVCVLYATKASLGLPFQWSPPFVFIITFATLFFLVLSITKDLTDIEGDMKHNIRTFPAIFGPKKVTFVCTGIILANYIGGIAGLIFMPQAFKSSIMLPAHAIFALWLLFQARKLDKANYTKEASANFFQFLWKLVNLEFLLFPFM